MRLAPALLWASQTIRGSFSICQMKCIPTLCGLAIPMCTLHTGGRHHPLLEHRKVPHLPLHLRHPGPQSAGKTGGTPWGPGATANRSCGTAAPLAAGTAQRGTSSARPSDTKDLRKHECVSCWPAGRWSGLVGWSHQWAQYDQPGFRFGPALWGRLDVPMGGTSPRFWYATPPPLPALRAQLVAKGQQLLAIHMVAPKAPENFFPSPCLFCPLRAPTLSLNRTLTLTPTPTLSLLLTLPPNLTLDPDPNQD